MSWISWIIPEVFDSFQWDYFQWIKKIFCEFEWNTDSLIDNKLTDHIVSFFLRLKVRHFDRNIIFCWILIYDWFYFIFFSFEKKCWYLEVRNFLTNFLWFWGEFLSSYCLLPNLFSNELLCILNIHYRITY